MCTHLPCNCALSNLFKVNNGGGVWRINYKNLFCNVIYRGEKIGVISELNNRRWVEWIMSWLYNAILSLKQVVLVCIITRKVVYYMKLNFKKQATKQFEFDTHFVKIRHAYAPPNTHTNALHTGLCSCLSHLLHFLLFSHYPRPNAQEIFLLP